VLDATNSAFGPALSFLPHGLAALLAQASPVEGANLQNPEELAGKIGLMRRGGIAFSAKVICGQRAAAVGVIVSQTGDVWPFTMTDSTGDLDVQIPSVMVAAAAGMKLEQLLARARQDSSHVLIHATAHHTNSSCAVCLELFQVDTDAVQLPCDHHFHEVCIAKWLAKSSACPCCRRDCLPAAGGGGEEAVHDATGAQREDFIGGTSMFG